MNTNGTAVNDITFEQVFSLVQQLPPIDQARLVVRLAPKIEWLLMQVESTHSFPPRIPLRGLLSDLGTAPSADEIDAVQQEMWSSFARESA